MRKEICYCLTKVKDEVKKIIVALTITVLIGIVIYWIGQDSDIAPSSQSIPVRIRYGFTIYNQTNTLVENAKFYTFAPVRASSFQECKTIEASHPFEKIQGPFDNQFLLFKLGKIPPYGNRIITITADVSLFRQPQKQTLQATDQFLKPEANIASDHPEIIKIAKSVSTADVSETTHHFFQWVSDHVQYERSSGSPKGAVYALTKQKGDCTEYADLFTSLCRAANILARSVGGYVCPQNTVLQSMAYHNWAEAYYKGTWHIVDPQKKQFPDGNTEYIATKIIHIEKDADLPNFEKFWISNPALRVKMN